MTKSFRQLCHVRVDHHFNGLAEMGPRFPTEFLPRLGVVTSRGGDLRGTQHDLVGLHMILPIQADAGKGNVAQFPDRVGGIGGNDIGLGLVLLHHQPHGLDELWRIPPVAHSIEVAQAQLGIQHQRSARLIKRGDGDPVLM